MSQKIDIRERRYNGVDYDILHPETNINMVLDSSNNSVGDVNGLLCGDGNGNITNATLPNAGSHNSIYRGKNLGTSVTAEQYAAITAGTFDDLYIGDYWVIDGVNWRIAAFDYYLTTGDTACNTHHVTIVPDTNLYSARMNETNTTAGAYVGSEMYTTNLERAKTIIKAAFGSAHILSHRELLTNAVSGDKASGSAWCDSTVDLMNEVMVYGCHAWGSAPSYETGIDKSQLALFALAPEFICNRAIWWLRDVVSFEHFARLGSDGVANRYPASGFFGVRPAFCIKS